MDNKNKNDDEFLKFVHLVKEYKVILSKSQYSSVKKQKRDAIAEMIPKWTNVSGQTLTEEKLLKKLHNMKQRANASAEKNVMTEWQQELLDLIGSSKTEIASEPNDGVADLSNDENTTTSSSLVEVDVQKKRKAEAALNILETHETRYLSNDQLQRFLMLKQIKLVDLQIQKMENEKEDTVLVEWDHDDNSVKLVE